MIPSLLAREWRDALLEYIGAVFPIRDDRTASALHCFLSDPRHGLFKEIYIRTRLPYRTADPEVPMPLTAVSPAFRPFVHQWEAFARLNSGQDGGPRPTLVVTGTGSGKTEAFLYPILDHCARKRRAGEPGIKAVILYPMNALAQDQARRLAGLLTSHPALRGVVSAGLYVGSTSESRSRSRTAVTEEYLIEDRGTLRDYPPDILLTNYKMLDQLLMRKMDGPLWRFNGPETLQYVVLDEMHTYDGVQFADVAALLRRLRARLKMAPGSMCPVGTSATLGEEGADAERRLRELAETVFGVSFPEGSVVRESRPALGGFLRDVEPASPPADPEALEPDPAEEAPAYRARQVQLWLGGPLSPAEAGERLRSHPWFHRLCKLTAGRVQPWSRLLREFGELLQEAGVEGLPGAPGEDAPLSEDAITARYLHSFLSVVAYAREADGRRPLLPLQVELWAREMRGVVRALAPEPRFRFVSDPAPELSPEDSGEEATGPDSEQRPEYLAQFGEPALPMIVCNRCGVDGWIALESEGGRLDPDAAKTQRVFARAETDRDLEAERLRLVFPGHLGMPEHGDARRVKWLPQAMRLMEGGDEAGGMEVIRVKPPQRGRGVDPTRCPFCGENDALLLVSMRRASESAVWIGHTVGSVHTENRKILSFADSVQDVAQLAGFIRHRGRPATLRTGVRKMLEAGYSGRPLEAILEDWQGFWRHPSRLGDDGYRRAFLERDETEEKMAGRFPRDVDEWTEETWKEVQAYVTWRVVRELGLHATLGRSLYLTGSAVIEADPGRVQESARTAAAMIREHDPVLAKGALEERVQGLIRGLVHRMVLMGGISHELLRSYREQGGSGYELTRDRNPLYEGSPRRPRFFVDVRPRRDSGLDALRGGTSSWIWHYVMKALLGPLEMEGLEEPVDAGALAVRTFDAMARSGLVDTVYWGSRATYGLRPAALHVHAETARLRCGVCRGEVWVPRDQADTFAASTPCLTYRCSGHYEREPERGSGYYSRIYRESRVEPIAAQEHSSLISDEVRRDVEKRFERGGARPVNVLVCTPTMEMGIDIGDLDTVLLLNVPPSAAGRVQRVGRAGRATGMALVGQIVGEDPHDQYYWQSPEELLAGRTDVPVCPLDAPEVLKRHLRAYLLDSWIRDRPEASIPRAARELLAEFRGQGFPHLWFSYVEANVDLLWQEFAGLFAGVSARTLNVLEVFLREGEWKRGVMDAVVEREEEINEALRHLRRLNERMQNPAVQMMSGEEGELREIQRTRGHVRSRLRALQEQNVLEWWTDEEGLLPNYAFPERAVVMKRYLPGKNPEEFARNPGAALVDFAPGSRFYAAGHQTVINHIPLSRAKEEIESWRACPNCQHMEPVGEAPPGPCPVCGELAWQDQGQVVQMIRLRQVGSRVAAREDTAINDRREERERAASTVKRWFDFQAAPTVRRRLPNRVFAYEFFPEVTVREIHFGPGDREAGTRRLGGEDVPRDGFTVCRECGATSFRDERGQWQPPRHVRGFSCDRNTARSDLSAQKVMQGDNGEHVVRSSYEENVYLYRDFRSEALRILLPVQQALQEERLATWEAILRLGLKRWMGGTSRQIGVDLYSEPVRGTSVRAHYLVLYDKIPGGTGYLRQLAESGKLPEVLRKAWEQIRDCGCGAHGRDGCYRCLYQYEIRYWLRTISRQLALQMLEPLVKAEPDWQLMDSSDGASGDGRPVPGGETENVPDPFDRERSALLESELEHLAQEALRERLERGLGREEVQWRPFRDGQAEGVRISWTEHGRRVSWRLVRQARLDTRVDLPFPTRPDFVLWPEPNGQSGAGPSDGTESARHGPLPVAVFCDGAEFHIGAADRYRLDRDILIREGIRRTGKFAVFTVTWEDVREALGEQGGGFAYWPDVDPYEGFSSEGFLRTLRFLEEYGGIRSLEDPGPRWRLNNLDLLVAYLRRPDQPFWRSQAQTVIFTVAEIDRRMQRVSVAQALTEVYGSLAAEHETGYRIAGNVPPEIGARQGAYSKEMWFGPELLLTCRLAVVEGRYRNGRIGWKVEGIVMLVDGDPRPESGSEAFRRAWRVFWHWHNFLQWLPTGLRFVSPKSLQLAADWELLDLMFPPHGLNGGSGGALHVGQPGAEGQDGERSARDNLRWLADVHPAVRGLAGCLVRDGVPKPEVGYEFLKGGRIVAEAELAWPEQRLCILYGEQAAAQGAIREQGWRVWVYPGPETDDGDGDGWGSADVPGMSARQGEAFAWWESLWEEGR